MDVKDAIVTEKNVTLYANWRYRRSHFKRIQLYRTDLQEISGPIWIKLKKLCTGQIFSAPPSNAFPYAYDNK